MESTKREPLVELVGSSAEPLVRGSGVLLREAQSFLVSGHPAQQRGKICRILSIL